MIYTARGTTTVDEWVDRALEDWETSAIEGHIGTWMEEVARIVSGGVKPGSGVDQYVAVLHGRRQTAALTTDPSITKLASDAFWEKASGIPDFRARLLKASTILASLVTRRAAAEVARIKTEATAIFGDAHGNLRLDVLANPPAGWRTKT
jgi:hypothetical protein